MRNVQEVIDRLKAIDENKPFDDAMKDSYRKSHNSLMAEAWRNNFEAIYEALGMGKLGCHPLQNRLDRMRNRIVELLEEAQASQEPQLPEGIEWPRTEDGKLVYLNEGLTAVWKNMFGKDERFCFYPTKIEFDRCRNATIYAEGITETISKIELKPGERVKTTEPDTQWKIDDDATMNPHHYCKNILHWDDRKRQEAKLEEKIIAMNKDLLRRQRELDARK